MYYEACSVLCAVFCGTNIVWFYCLRCSEWSDSSRSQIAPHHITRHNTPIHNILSTAPQLNISQKALETLPEDGNVMPKHVGTTIHN
jgi:hypothetical protein